MVLKWWEADVAASVGFGAYGAMINPYCCQRLASDLAHTCAVHPDRTDCPDAFIAEMNGGFGLMVHDGGSSAVEIAFCPWCGAALPPMEH